MTRIPASFEKPVPPARPEDLVERFAARPVSQRLQRRRTWTMTLNLTPMIDVIFLLLSFFVMVSRFTMPEGVLRAELPAHGAASPAAEVPREPIRILLTTDPERPAGCLAIIERLHPDPLPLHQLAGQLVHIRRTVPGYDTQTPVLLAAGDDVAWEHVVNAYNAAILAEHQRVFFSEPGKP